jgi:predicted P-loop ATPase
LEFLDYEKGNDTTPAAAEAAPAIKKASKKIKIEPVKIEKEAPEDKPAKKDKGEDREPLFKLAPGEALENYLLNKYSFMFNEIKGKPEFIDLTSDAKKFIPLDRYNLNSIKREVTKKGIKTNVQELKELLESDFCPRVNPVREYLNQLPPYDGTGKYIDQLAATITTPNPEIWREYLKKWLVAVVANALHLERCLNHVCLVLTGGQGAGKTTWLENLCPSELRPYLFTGKIRPDNKDVLSLIAECFLINIDDQLKNLNKADENELKNLITVNKVKYRRPYSEFIDEHPHLASFCASVNDKSFLTDVTGSRRFLPFEVLAIDRTAAPVNMDKVYAEALYYFREGFRYWFNDDEIKELNQHNEDFRVVTEEEELVVRYIDKPKERKDATHFYTATDIKVYLEEKTRQRLSTKKIGESLTKLRFERWQRTVSGSKQWVYSVIKKSDEELYLEATSETTKPAGATHQAAQAEVLFHAEVEQPF